MASCAPTRVRMRVEAHLPKAAEPPALFIMQTMAPRITRKIRMPTLEVLLSTDIMPPSKMCSTVPSNWKFE